MNAERTREPQYERTLEVKREKGLASLGLMTNALWDDDPRHLVFLLSRYKFVSKMFSGKKRVLEVGCGDGIGTRIVRQEVESIVAVDFDPVFVKDIQERMDDRWRFECRVHDMLSGPVEGGFEAIYSLDVLEHIAKESERRFLDNLVASLLPHGEAIIGMPSLQSQVHASPPSKVGHVNCKDAKELKALLQDYFKHVFIFSMNDEVVHTGFAPMAHYLFALCAEQKTRS